MYYRSPAYIDIASLTRAICVLSEAKPLPLASRLLLSAGMIVAPVLVLVVVLGTGWLVSGL